MNLFIYKVKNIDLNVWDFEKIHDVIINNHDSNSIKGKIFDNVDFIYKYDSKFLFLITEKRSHKRKAFKLFYNIFDGNIFPFSPSFNKERKMICDADYKDIKFFQGNEIVCSNKLNESFCNHTLKDEYYFFDAELHFLLNKIEYRFKYYRDCIIISRDYEKRLFEILGIFEKYMSN